MQHNTYRITTLINEVLEMSKLDASATWDDMSEIPVNDELHRVIGDFRKEVQRTEENLQFVTTLDDSFMFRSQEGVLGRMLTPLLDNAVKSTPEGIVTLRAETNGKQLVLTVEDQGIGIPAEKAEQIFERFFKLDSFTEGLGLGLTYSRVLARRMGGDVKLDTSYQGPGARFVVTLPIKK
jgi:signal transduction histidine kinase